MQSTEEALIEQFLIAFPQVKLQEDLVTEISNLAARVKIALDDKTADFDQEIKQLRKQQDELVVFDAGEVFQNETRQTLELKCLKLEKMKWE